MSSAVMEIFNAESGDQLQRYFVYLFIFCFIDLILKKDIWPVWSLQVHPYVQSFLKIILSSGCFGVLALSLTYGGAYMTRHGS